MAGVKLLLLDALRLDNAEIGNALVLFDPRAKAAVPGFIQSSLVRINLDDITIRGWHPDSCMGLVETAGEVFSAAFLDEIHGLWQSLFIGGLVANIDLDHAVDWRALCCAQELTCPHADDNA